MTVTFPDMVGFLGVAFIVATYLLVQLGKMDVHRPLYPALNGLGAALILYSLAFTFNLASFVIEIFWLIASLIGLWRSIFLQKSK